MVNVLPIDTIVSDSTIKDGQPIIAGTQVRVRYLVARHLYRGPGPETLAVNYKLSLGQAYAALAYYQHKGEIEMLIQQDALRADTFLKKLEQDGRLIRVE